MAKKTKKAIISEEKAKIISDAKEMIKKVEEKEMKSLNQPNKKAPEYNWDDF